MELVLPQQLVSTNFVRTLVHPSLSSSSDFLGYVQPRPTAPFPYSNAWGNNLALYLPFFVLGWFGRDAGWRRKVGPLILLAAIFPITFSLNRGLWLSLALAAVYAAFRLAVNGRGRALQVLVASVLVGGIVFVSSPLYDTLLLRVETPHSNDRRAGTAETVASVTAQGSPVVGYGTTRTMQGSFSSLAGGATEQCRQCAPPPLGTQGFMWRLVLTTGFVGTALCLSFFALQFLRRARGPAPLDVTTLHGAAGVGPLLLRLRLPRLGAVHVDDRDRPDGPQRPGRGRGGVAMRSSSTDSSASYAAEVARLLWPEPWDAPHVTRTRHRGGLPHRDAYLFPSERRPRLLVPADVPGSSTHAAAARQRARPAAPARCGWCWSARSAPAPSPWRGGRCCACRERTSVPTRSRPTSPSASGLRSGSASCSAPDGSTRSPCSRSSTWPDGSSATPRSATTT